MNPGLVIKLRPAGPWRIGPDSGARNRVDVIYHSDSLYSAVTSAMARMGSLEEWLDATARTASPAVCFSSCFPFLEETQFVVPPRTLWPPTSPARTSARVRWKSARFVPVSVVRALLSGQKLNANQWSVDGASGCLVPDGKAGPFRTGVRCNAAVDRLSGASERHATACIEFRTGSGLWTVVGFADEAARDRWQDPVKAAFRLLADTGFGGERSRGWGRAESPEFVEGSLPEMILPEQAPVVEAPVVEAAVLAPAETAGMKVESEITEAAEEVAAAPEEVAAATEEIVAAPEEVAAVTEEVAAAPEEAVAAPEEVAAAPEEAAPAPEIEPEPEPEPEPEAPAHELAALAAGKPSGPPLQAHWLLSLFTPAPADAVDWGRGSYTVLARGGRIESPAGSGELKKQIQMVAEGSVLFADGVPRGAAPDVAPDGFAHPVFRAGFALSIRLPEVH
jgi:CRISPR type III-A-associated RAMP protein Csm4